MKPISASLQALIESTEALDIDQPQLATVPDTPQPQRGAFSMIGQLISTKPLNPQTVCDTLQHAWKFALPLSFAVVGHHKYLFGVPLQAHVTKILDLGPWNVRGSLLLLQPWTPELAITEIQLHLCPFWVQVHGLPCQNMAAVNSVIIGQRIGKILEVDDLDSTGPICQPFLRFRVALDTSKPLLPGFFLPRPGKEPLWISFRYERLGDYCTLCGLIGHKKNQCLQPPNRISPEKYRIPLQTFSLYGIRQNLSPSREDSDSGVSSVGTSHSHSDAQSSPAHGAESALQLAPSQFSPHPTIHVDFSPGSQAMQLVSSSAALRGTLQSFPAVHYPDNSIVASPHQLHFLPFDFCTQVGVNPFTVSSRPFSSPASLHNTSHLGASRLSAVDKGKSPLNLVPSDPSLTNISHPCPITISPPVTYPAHFTLSC
jgi:hypothetical protein